MNGINGLGSVDAAGATDAAGADFDSAFNEGIVNTSLVLMQFIGADIIQSVMKDETAVD